MTENSETPTYPSMARARYAQVVLAGLALFSAMDMQVLGLLIEPIKQELGLTDFQVGLTQATSFYAAYGLLAVPMGILTDRMVRVRLLIVAMLLWSCGLLATALSHSVWMLAGSKALMGVASAITYPAAMSLLADYFAPDRRAFATASYPIGQDLGQVGALLVGGLGYGALVAMVAADPNALGGLSPWRVVSLIFVGFGLLLIPLLLGMREPPRMEVRDAGKGSFSALWDYRAFLLPLFAGIMFLSLVASAVRVWALAALVRLYGLQPDDFAMSSSAIVLVAGIASLLLGSKLINVARASGDDRRMIMPAVVASILCAPASFVATMPNTIWFAVLATLFLLVSGIAIAVPVMAISFRIPNELRGLSMGLYVVLVAIAGMIGAPLVGALSTAMGGDMMLGWAMAAVGAPASLLTAFSLWFASRAPADISDPIISEA
jgi:MFS family permease